MTITLLLSTTGRLTVTELPRSTAYFLYSLYLQHASQSTVSLSMVE